MSEFLSDQEQEERVKKWIKTHGYNALIAVLLGLSAYFGYQYWVNKKATENAVASNQFQGLAEQKQKLQTLLVQNQPVPKADNTKFLSGVDELVKNHPKSIFSQQALMMKSQYLVERNEFKKAVLALKNAKDIETGEKGLSGVITLRIAKVLIADKQPEKALEQLAKLKESAFATSKLELQGDAYIAQNKVEEAKKAYSEAWTSSQKENDPNQILRLKMETIGLTPNDHENKADQNNQKEEVANDN